MPMKIDLVFFTLWNTELWRWCDVSSGIATRGSGSSMNRGPQPPKGPPAARKKLNQQIFSDLTIIEIDIEIAII